jgi:hypothetical protein
MVLYPGLVAVVIATVLYGQLSLSSGLGGLIWAIFVVAVFLMPFVPIAIALRAGWIETFGYVFGLVVAVASLAVVPWGVDRIIAGDSSSTAGLLHLYDPALDTLAVTAAIGAAALARRVHR